MKRLEELVQRQLDGELTAAEEQELETLLDSDPEALRMYQQLLEIETGLRNLDESVDVSDAVMAEINPPVTPVVTPRQVQALAPAPHKSPSLFDSVIDRWFLPLAVPIAGVAGLVLAFVLFQEGRFETGDSNVPKTAATSLVEGFEVVRAEDASTESSKGLQPKDQLVAKAGKKNRLLYEDRTEVRLTEGSRVVYEAEFSTPESPSKRLELVTGTMQADVSPQPAGQPLVIKTPHAQAIVRGTKFTLSSTPEQTRLEVDEGRVDLRRESDGAMVAVRSGMFAISTKGDLISLPQRVSTGLLAYYTFQEGAGNVVQDRSGRGNPLDLKLSGGKPNWSSQGLTMSQPHFLRSDQDARKLIDACRKSGEVTLEAWVQPASARQKGPARIITLSDTSKKVDVMLAHGGGDGTELDTFVGRLRSTKHPNDAELRAPKGKAATKLTHLVFSRDAKGNAKLFVDGRQVSQRDVEGDLANWHDDLKLALGNDPGESQRFWNGSYRLVAIYDRALSQAEVDRNFAAGAVQVEEFVSW